MKNSIDSRTYVFTFGAYKGEKYEDVVKKDPKYVYWCHDNVEWFELDDDDLEEVVDEINKDHYDDSLEVW